MPGALDGVKVLEIAQVMAIPICGALLSDMGAEVVKLEPPWGDASRHTLLPVLPGESKSFAVFNRGKRSVGLDVADERTRPAVEALVRWADVVLVSVVSEKREAYRLGYDDLRPLNPEMIYLDHVPFGRKGPMGDLGGYDLVVQGVSGAAALIGKERRGQPALTQPAFIDMGTGYLSAMGVCAALFARRNSGRGQRVETSLLSTAMTTLCNTAHQFPAVDPSIVEQFLDGLADLRSDGAGYREMQALRNQTVRRGARGNIYYRFYKTSDSFISAGCLSPALQARFREATGLHDPSLEPDFDLSTPEAYERMGQLEAEAEALMETRTSAEWLALLRGLGIPCGPVNFPEEAVTDPQVTENGYMVELEHGLLGPYKTFAPPVRMEGTPTRAQGPAPLLAEHTNEVLREAGLSDGEIENLVREGLAGARLPAGDAAPGPDGE